jgi:hypothetical protein
MTTGAVVCLVALVINVTRDLFFVEMRAVEVWLGFEVRGPLALLSAPLHWAIFGAGAWAFWTQRPWAVGAAAAYLFYAALSHLIWSEASPNGRGWPIGLLQAAAISTVALALLRFRGRSTAGDAGTGA